MLDADEILNLGGLGIALLKRCRVQAYQPSLAKRAFFRRQTAGEEIGQVKHRIAEGCQLKVKQASAHSPVRVLEHDIVDPHLTMQQGGDLRLDAAPWLHQGRDGFNDGQPPSPVPVD